MSDVNFEYFEILAARLLSEGMEDEESGWGEGRFAIMITERERLSLLIEAQEKLGVKISARSVLYEIHGIRIVVE